MSKGKSALSAGAEHFISSLPLEEAAELMSGLAAPGIAVTLTQLNADVWRFEVAQTLQAKSGAVGLQGTLRRWEGTFTRVDCRTYRQTRSIPGFGPLVVGLFMAAVIAWGVMISARADILVAFSFAPLILFFLVFRWLNVRFRNDVRGRDATHLLEWVIGAFKSAGNVSLDTRAFNTAAGASQ